MSAIVLQPRHTAAAPASQWSACWGSSRRWSRSWIYSPYRLERAREVSGSVGGHVRHCLDHVAALVRGLVERSHRLRRARAAVESRREERSTECGGPRMPARDCRHTPDMPVWVDVGGPDFAPSTLARELAFVSSHTIHHFADLRRRAAAARYGYPVPPRFGRRAEHAKPGAGGLSQALRCSRPTGSARWPR